MSASSTQSQERGSAARPEPKSGIFAISPYVPGKARIEGVADPIKLSSNENILGASPAARAAFLAAADSLHVYPDSRAGALRAAVAEHFGLEPERLVFGDGTDEVLHLLNQAFLEPGDNIVMGDYGFGAYSIGARACQGEVHYAAEPNHTISVDSVLEKVDARTRLVFLTQPGNPTGTYLSGAELARLHAGLPSSVVLVLDGAYAEFADQPDFDDGLALARANQNVIATRTFSKLHGLAALRIGWMYCPAHIADAVDRIRPPFNTSIAAQNAAVASLADTAFQAVSRDHVIKWRGWLAEQLGALGLDVTPSQANFVLFGFPATPGKTAAEAAAYLEKRGYIVRAVANYGLPNHLRVTIGREEHNRAVIALLAEFLQA